MAARSASGGPAAAGPDNDDLAGGGSRSTPWRGQARLAVALALAGLAAAGIAGAWSAWQRAERGAQLFDGRVPLQAKIQGHDAWLPPSASRCINCHDLAHHASVGAAQAADRPTLPAAAARFGPTLGPALLAVDQARRGGPPSRYDAARLCQLLRTGVDPAWVMLPRAMPRYQLSDADCSLLWSYLTG